QAVADRLAVAGVSADQVIVRSDGERNLVTTAPGQYRLNRRGAYDRASRPGPSAHPTPGRGAPESRAGSGPPFHGRRRHVPHPRDADLRTPGQPVTSSSTQLELEDWRWGNIPPTLRTEVDKWVRDKAASATGGIAGNPALDDQTVEGYTVRPRPVVQGM